MQMPITAVLKRPRLLNALDRTLSARFVLVTAPAGYGKSILLRDWVDGRPDVDSVWLSLDRRDNDPVRFWRRTLEALEAATVRLPDRIGRALGAGRPGEILRAIELLNDFLADVRAQLVFVFDDFHLLHAPSVLEPFEFFRDTSPEDIGVVLAGRRDPPLGVARLRVLDELIEIRQNELRFTASEVGALAEDAGLHLDAEAIARLHALTDGWAAALRLALVSIGGRDDPGAVLAELGETDRNLADFFSEEVLGEIPDTTREFLLSTAILDQMNASLARAVSGTEDAWAVLEDLASRSMLTSRLEGPGEWLQYHQLFQRLLRLELYRHKAEADIGELNRRAASWYREHGDLEGAIPYAIAASDPEVATDWLAELSPQLMAAGRAATLLDLSEQIIETVAEPTPLQLICKGEALHGLGDRPEELDQIIDYIEERLTGAVETARTKDWAAGAADPHAWESPSSLPWVHAVRSRRKGDADALIALNVPGVVPSPSKVVEGEIAEAMIWLEWYSEAEHLLEISHSRADTDAYAPHIVHYLGLLAASRAGQGRFADAQAITTRALSLCFEHELGQLRHTMYARLVDAWLAWSRGDLERAESKAIDVQIFAEHAADVPLAVQHAQLRSAVRWSLGDAIGARALLDGAAVTATGWAITGHFADRLLFTKARFDLLDGDPGAAQLVLPDWRDRLDVGPSTMREWLLLMRLVVAADGPGAVVDERPPSGLDPSLLHLIEWQRIRAHALDLSGDRAQAVDELSSSLTKAGRLWSTQVFLDERRILGSLLPLAAKRARVDLPGLDVLEDAAVPRPVYVESLTDREQAVLRLLATHLSYAEIAAELYVSKNTIKTHQRSIYRKLAVAKRSDAVARARAYGLIG